MVPPERDPKLEKPLTEVELELMNVVWDKAECTVRDVQEALPKDRQLAYTSVATIMKILEQKKIVKSLKKEKAHVFYPVITRDEYQAISLKHLTENVFKGDPASMVARLLNDSDLTIEELKNLKSLLNERLKT